MDQETREVQSRLPFFQTDKSLLHTATILRDLCSLLANDAIGVSLLRHSLFLTALPTQLREMLIFFIVWSLPVSVSYVVVAFQLCAFIFTSVCYHNLDDDPGMLGVVLIIQMFFLAHLAAREENADLLYGLVGFLLSECRYFACRLCAN